MTTTSTTAMQPSMSRALALLATGHTIQRVSELVDWPLGSIRALINGQRGWLLGTDDRVSCPGSTNGVTIPAGVDPAHLEWARKLHQQPAAAQFREPEPPPPAPPAKQTPAPDELTVVMVPLDKIHAHPRNVRADVGDVTEFADSIRTHGLLQPLTLRPHPTLEGDYETIAGHRRHVACIEAGLALVPCVIRLDVSDAAVLEMMIVENVHRRGLNPIERAEAFGRLRDEYGYSAAQIAERTGLTSSTVSTTLALLDLAPKTRERVRRGELKVGDALKLVRRHRAKQRTATGGGAPGATWEPDHFTDSHALARKARALCQAREHTSRRHLGNVACGQCWETVIRGDERIVVAAEQEAPGD
ncbi:ParB/RepB/Spo0J family partition protein [Nonomuraea polychroma]|uniref:ParB/RepB/Spo0J family partition protein n=1 Tax=Nonomuraea polychroma TaxID=46176 RepID=UPI003D8E67A1